MSDKHPVRTGIIVTVFGGLLLAAILKLLGYVDELFRFLQRVITTVGDFAMASVALPRWIVIGLGLSIIVQIVNWVRSRLRSLEVPQHASVDQQAQLPSTPMLDELQSKILLALGVADGTPLSMDRLHDETRSSRLRITAALEELFRYDLVEPHHDYLHGTRIALTSKGRDFLIRARVV